MNYQLLPMLVLLLASTMPAAAQNHPLNLVLTDPPAGEVWTVAPISGYRIFYSYPLGWLCEPELKRARYWNPARVEVRAECQIALKPAIERTQMELVASVRRSIADADGDEDRVLLLTKLGKWYQHPDFYTITAGMPCARFAGPATRSPIRLMSLYKGTRFSGFAHCEKMPNPDLPSNSL